MSLHGGTTLEGEKFVCKIIPMAQPVHLWDGTSQTYEELHVTTRTGRMSLRLNIVL
jgi:hypothetical protein